MALAIDPLIRMRGISKIFHTEDVETHALSRIDLEIRAGEYVAIAGPSGCGKTTLLSILGLLDSPSEGSYVLAGRAGGDPLRRAAGPSPEPRRRLHLPGLQSDRRPQRLSERGAAAHVPGPARARNGEARCTRRSSG